MRGRRVVIGAVLAVAATAVTVALLSPWDEDGSEPGPVFYLLGDEWTIAAANDPDEPIAVEPTLDWYAEYDRDVAGSPAHVRLSGHTTSLYALGSELPGFELEPITVLDRSGVAGVGDEDTGPAVVAYSVEPGYLIMLLSYELTVDELVELANDLQPVSAGEFADADPDV